MIDPSISLLGLHSSGGLGTPRRADLKVQISTIILPAPDLYFLLGLLSPNEARKKRGTTRYACRRADADGHSFGIRQLQVLSPQEHSDMTLKALLGSAGDNKLLKMFLARTPEFQGAEHDKVFDMARIDDTSESSYSWKSSSNHSRCNLNMSYAFCLCRTHARGLDEVTKLPLD